MEGIENSKMDIKKFKNKFNEYNKGLDL